MDTESSAGRVGFVDLLCVVVPGFVTILILLSGGAIFLDVIGKIDLPTSGEELGEWKDRLLVYLGVFAIPLLVLSYVLGMVPRAAKVSRTDKLCLTMFHERKDPDRVRTEIKEVK